MDFHTVFDFNSGHFFSFNLIHTSLKYFVHVLFSKVTPQTKIILTFTQYLISILDIFFSFNLIHTSLKYFVHVLFSKVTPQNKIILTFTQYLISILDIFFFQFNTYKFLIFCACFIFKIDFHTVFELPSGHFFSLNLIHTSFKYFAPVLYKN